jgi:hypothetical protein
MMSDQIVPVALQASAALLALVIVAMVALRGWQGWLALKERELDLRRTIPAGEQGSREGMQRIEIADLKERVRQLEAIASGVDL